MDLKAGLLEAAQLKRLETLGQQRAVFRRGLVRHLKVIHQQGRVYGRLSPLIE